MSDQFIGPTRDYPHGKLNDADDGGLQMAMAVDPASETVQIHFGTPVKWLAMTSSDARELSKMLNIKADELDKMLKEHPR